MDEVITFDKTLQQRLKEYKDVLSGYEVLPVSAIQKEWSFYLELTLDPNGWQAVWKLQRRDCEHLKISFPTIVLVFVLNVNLDNLTALVKVLAVQDDIHIPDKHYVPLTQLWPTKEQDQSIVLNLQSTANALDMLRFFYHHLLMPWDYDDDNTTDWKSKHLESRLRLYYDMKNGVIPRATAEHLHSLLTEAKHLQIKREKIESKLDDLDDPFETSFSPDVEALTELHIRLMEIKCEVDILENPLFRKVVIKRQKESQFTRQNEGKQNVWLVYEEGTVDDHVEFLEKVKQYYPEKRVRFASHLSTTLETATERDVFVLNEATHQIRTTGALEGGGILKGLSTRDRTVVTSSIEDVMLDFNRDDVLLENLTVKANTAKCAIIVRGGAKVTLNNCKISGDSPQESSTHQGIIVLAGGQLEMIDCEISDFSMAVVGNSGSQITLKTTHIHDVNLGLKVYDDCTVRLTKSTISNCLEYGVCVETEKSAAVVGQMNCRVGGFETLNIIPQFQMELIKGDNNAKGDAVINQKSKLRPVKDLFENPDLDPTVCTDNLSEEEMEMYEGNATVIENPRSGNVSPATV